MTEEESDAIHRQWFHVSLSGTLGAALLPKARNFRDVYQQLAILDLFRHSIRAVGNAISRAFERHIDARKPFINAPFRFVSALLRKRSNRPYRM